MVSMSRGRIDLARQYICENFCSPEVDDLDLDALVLLELLSSLETVGDHLGVGNQSDVGTLTLNLGLADWDKEVLGHLLLGHREGDTVEQLVLKETDWVGIPNGGLQETLAVGCAPRRDDLEAGDRAVPCSVALELATLRNLCDQNHDHSPESAGQRHRQRHRWDHGK